MGCRDGGVNTLCGSGVGSCFACETGSDPMGLALGSEPFPVEREPTPLPDGCGSRITGKKNPRRSEEFFRWCPEEDSNLHGFTR